MSKERNIDIYGFCQGYIGLFYYFRWWLTIRPLDGSGKRLKSAIQDKGYTQKELSEILFYAHTFW